MKLIRIEPTEHGFFLDPKPYVDQLAQLTAELPPGAAAFANDPGHYDFYSLRCPKDLKLDRMGLTVTVVSADLVAQWREPGTVHDPPPTHRSA